jgi:hypothetical protein
MGWRPQPSAPGMPRGIRRPGAGCSRGSSDLSPPRASRPLASIITGTVLTLGTMIVVGDIYANSPIFAGLIGSLVAYVAGSLLTKPTPEPIMAEWDRRITSERHYVAPVADETSPVA